MARTIAIELEVNGVKESINTINDLEGAIESLTEELKSTDIGSERFNQLSNELNTARSQLKTFEQTFEGLDPQQKTQAYLAFGESVVSGVLLAQEALRAFGVENENVNAAVEKSTQAINIALQARVVVEGILEARVIATTIAQNALNTSIVAGNRVLKILFTTMAANPVGAILAVITLLVGAIIAFTDASDDAASSTERMGDAMEDAQKKVAKTSVELDFYAGIVNDVTKSEEERAQALEELNRLGVITDGITLDNVASLDKLNERLELARENILLKAQSEAAAELLSEALKAQIEAQNSTLEENISWWDRTINYVTSGGNAYAAAFRNAKDGVENQQEAINNATSDVEEFEKIYLDILKRLNENEAKLREERNKSKKDAEDLNKQFEDFNDTIKQSSREVDRLNRNLLKFGEVPSPPIIQELENLVELQLELQRTTEESKKTLGDTFTDYFETAKQASSATDDFGIQYEKTRKTLTDAFKTGELEKFNQAVDDVRETYFGEEGEFTKEQQLIINQLLSGYSTAFQQLRGLGTQTEDEFKNVVEPLLDSLAQKLRLEGDIRFETDAFELALSKNENLTNKLYEYRKEIYEILEKPVFDETTTEEERVEKINEYKEQVKLLSIEFDKLFAETKQKSDDGVLRYSDAITEYQLDLKEVIAGTDEFYRLRTDLIDRFTEQFLKESELVTMTEEQRQETEKNAREAAEERVESIINIITETTKVEDSIRGVANEVEDLRNQAAENNKEIDTLLGLILTNFDQIKEEFDLTDLDPSGNLLENYQENYDLISQFFEDIGFEGFEILVRTEQDKLDVVELFLKKRQELLEENKDKEEEIQEDLVQTTIDNYTQILDGLNQLTLSLSEASQLQIDRVESNTQEALSNIVGDTKEAEELRTEIQEESSRKIVEIERTARLRELQFTKIQATADLAQSLINALKLPPPFNAIQASIIGAAGSIQIATIQGQIDDLQSAQGFATGGYVEGPGTGTSDSIPAMLSNGEFVVNAKATEKFLPLLEEINNNDNQFRKFANGGFVMDSSFIPSTSTIQNIFDDSRIIDELRRTRQEPLRAYVFEKDITDAQQIEKRLRELSKL